MDKFERTMREERWMLTAELFASDRPEPPEVAAFRLLQEPDWMHFMMEVDTPAMKFFNPEIREFSGASDWQVLTFDTQLSPFEDELAIPQSVPTEVQDFCRDLRNSMRALGEEGCGGCKAFYSPEEWTQVSGNPVSRAALMVICHDGGNMAPRFNLDYEQYKLYDSIDPMLRPRGLWRDHMTSVESRIYRL